jgi:uncharacterized protein YkwD
VSGEALRPEPGTSASKWGISYRWAGEIIAYNSASDAETARYVVNQWMNSSGHRSIILSSNPTHYPTVMILMGAR